MLTRDLDYGIGSHIKGLKAALEQKGVEVSLNVAKGNLRSNLRKVNDDSDILHIQGSCFGASAAGSKPTVTTVHTLLKVENQYENSLRNRAGALFEKIVLRRSEQIIAVNDIQIEELTKLYDVSQDKITVIRNAVDVAEFDCQLNNPMVQKHRYKSGNGYAMTCGRDIKRKDFNTFIKGCAKAHLAPVIVRAVKRRDLITEFLRTPVFVCSSLYETGAIVVMEAMAAMTPVVATDISAVRELVIDGETGLLYQPGNPDDLADKLRWIVQHEAEARIMVLNARRHISQYFNWEDRANATIGVYKKVLR